MLATRDSPTTCCRLGRHERTSGWPRQLDRGRARLSRVDSPRAEPKPKPKPKGAKQALGSSALGRSDSRIVGQSDVRAAEQSGSRAAERTRFPQLEPASPRSSAREQRVESSESKAARAKQEEEEEAKSDKTRKAHCNEGFRTSAAGSNCGARCKGEDAESLGSKLFTFNFGSQVQRTAEFIYPSIESHFSMLTIASLGLPLARHWLASAGFVWLRLAGCRRGQDAAKIQVLA